ncbi:hypothetical protein HanIR_Chr05g0250211 [Helianthus annuus]|nr:hypothetical protein HanIR_Chr05g0250211 [Helianthus annuus]
MLPTFSFLYLPSFLKPDLSFYSSTSRVKKTPNNSMNSSVEETNYESKSVGNGNKGFKCFNRCCARVSRVSIGG